MSKKKQSKGSGLLGRIIRRFFLLLFTLIVLLVVGLALAMNLVFNGPSTAARDALTMTLLEPSATKWIPGLFMSEELVDSIKYAGKDTDAPSEETDTSQIVINLSNASASGDSEWAAYPDGIRFEDYHGKTFNAHIMIVKDPSRVSLGVSYKYNGSNATGYSTSNPGVRLNQVMANYPNVIAAVNGGAFNDDGTSKPEVGSVAAGVTVADGVVISDSYRGFLSSDFHPAFAGFNTDNILIVAENMTIDKANEWKIRDGCEFGPLLIVNSEVNQSVYSCYTGGYNPRTAIGQRADGAVIFVCADGRQAGSMGATFKDVTDIMIEYGAVNAACMDGGSSSIMYYRDTEGRYGNPGEVQMMNSYSVLQSEPRRMPTFWMVSAQQ